MRGKVFPGALLEGVYLKMATASSDFQSAGSAWNVRTISAPFFHTNI